MTCRKAREFLAQRGVTFEEREFFQRRLSADELRQVLGGRSPRELFAWKSTRSRQLGLAEKQHELTDAQLFEMMLQEPTFIRRPLLVADGRWIAGFNPREVEQFLQAVSDARAEASA